MDSSKNPTKDNNELTKNTKNTKIVLMSPAGSIEALHAAINNGADAVYLGVKNFNARRKNMGNFTFENLPETIKLAHFHNVEVFVTLNTLIKNNELDLWFDTLDKVYRAGADAVIIQDLFLLPYIKKNYPNLKIHISTQASIMNYAGLKNWENYANRVVLSRELDYEEITEIAQKSKIPLEVFCHGHLCISYSGQCLISSLIGKRSGNRGLCASSCRKEYNRNGYLLSPKDLALLNKIPQMIESGIHTIKIEGRMKSPEYVGTVTKYYRKAIDNYYVNKWQNFTHEDFNQIRMSFNRDFTTGFFDKNNYKNVLSPELPTHRGIFIGKIKNKTLKLEYELYVHDGIGFWDHQKKEMKGIFVPKIIENKTEINYAKEGSEVYIPLKNFKDGASVYLTSKSNGKSFIGELKKYNLILEIITCEFRKPLVLKGIHNDVEKTLISLSEIQEAKNVALSKEDIEEKLNKNDFFNVKLSGNLEQNLFLPSSSLTDLKNQLNNIFLPEIHLQKSEPLKTHHLLKNEMKIENNNDNNDGKINNHKTYTKTQNQLCVRVDSVELVKKVAPFSNIIYFDLLDPKFNEAKTIAKNINPLIKFFAYTQLVLSDLDIENIIKLLKKEKPEGIMISNHGLLRVEQEIDFPLEKHGYYTLNVFNDLGVTFLGKEQITPIISLELTSEELFKFKNKEFMVYVHGRPIVMSFKGVREEKQLTDELDITFPLVITPQKNTEMLYSRKIALLDKIKSYLSNNIGNFYLEFFERDYKNSFDYVTTEIEVYKKVLEKKDIGDISLLKRGTTIGNFVKGVM